MTALGSSFLTFPNDPKNFSPDACFPYLMEYAPIVITYFTNEQTLATVYNQTIAMLMTPTLKAIENTGSTITVNSGEILRKALSPIVGKLNMGFRALAERVRCGVQPVLCSTVEKFSEIIPIKRWRINFIKAPPNSY